MFFDVDGTLVPRTSSGQHLANLLGRAEVVRHAEAGYAAGTLSNAEVSVLDACGWATRTPADVRGFLESLPLVDGIAETVSWCRRHGLAPVLATLAWEPVGTYLCDRFGFDQACGPRSRPRLSRRNRPPSCTATPRQLAERHGIDTERPRPVCC
uniref:Haloacid dehalogenase-like hydrolase n=1 Tax=Micromonospora carbonacea TaxID=47853 RepID=A0A7D6CFQ9_9ACTN|nr:haloacid dehalogenase-like hydrolase [Micromonospora sp. ATCC 39149]QLJ98491.1 haloacid dehalogenase-like hydrolase [Micromonospora carbonacea]